MPSCDGSNCSACNCACEVRYESDTHELNKLKEKIAKLEKELSEKKTTEAMLREIMKEITSKKDCK